MRISSPLLMIEMIVICFIVCERNRFSHLLIFKIPFDYLRKVIVHRCTSIINIVLFIMETFFAVVYLRF